MLTKGTCLRFYKRKNIQNAIIAHAQDKEIGVQYGQSFGKRPDVLQYPREILELALQGATSFHASEEIWSDPLALGPDVRKEELQQLRLGWDLVLDIDCKVMEYSRVAAHLIIQFLKYCQVSSISVKFSGNKGFHIGVPFLAFPQQFGTIPTKNLFPEAPRKIAAYIKENIKEELGKRILEFEAQQFSKVREKVSLPTEELIRYQQNQEGDKIAKLNVDAFLEIDTILLASRHLYRLPYSLHEKSGLASLPLDPEKVLLFEKVQAQPDIIIPQYSFLSRENVSPDNARRLLLQAWDFEVKSPLIAQKSDNKNKLPEMTLTSPITEEFFPPCMLAMLKGMEDGKKRALFCLMNYLGKVGWNQQQVEEYLTRWNQEKNPEPLREAYLKGQFAHFRAGERLPPNCDNESYYKSLGLACTGGHCQKFKNPVNYTLWRWRRYFQQQQENEEKAKRKTSAKETGKN